MFGKPIPLFKLARFQIALDWSWVIIAVLITWTLATGVFPYYYPDLTPAAYWSVAAPRRFTDARGRSRGHPVAARATTLALTLGFPYTDWR